MSSNFACAKCNCILLNKLYYKVNRKDYCQDCYDKNFLPKCFSKWILTRLSSFPPKFAVCEHPCKGGAVVELVCPFFMSFISETFPRASIGIRSASDASTATNRCWRTRAHWRASTTRSRACLTTTSATSCAVGSFRRTAMTSSALRLKPC